MLRRLWENKLFVKAEKCSFHTDSVSFLGFVVQRGQLQADPEKVRAVSEWPVPTTRKQLQRFLGFANFYRRFIRDYSRVAAPLTQLTSTKVPFGWSQAARSTFLRLKKLFSSAVDDKYCVIPIQLSSSWWRWMPPTLGWEQCCPSARRWTTNYIPVPFSPVVLARLRLTMTLVTGSC